MQINSRFISGDPIAAVELVLAEAAQATGTLGDAATYFLERPGKRVRVRFCLELAESLRIQREQAIAVAAAVEMLHGASLVLDDVQDNDEMRRDRASVWRKFGRAQAINLGAYLIAESFAHVARLPGITPLFAAALRDATIGQSAELDSQSCIPSFAAYAAMAEKKTGALFALPAKAVAVLAQVPDKITSRIGLSFARLGVAYQIQDDIADALGQKGRARAGLDLREGKTNSVILFHLAQEPADYAAFHTFRCDRSARKDDAQLDAWLGRLWASGSIALARNHLQELCGDIAAGSTAFPDPFASHLTKLARSIADANDLQHVNGRVESHFV